MGVERGVMGDGSLIGQVQAWLRTADLENATFTQFCDENGLSRFNVKGFFEDADTSWHALKSYERMRRIGELWLHGPDFTRHAAAAVAGFADCAGLNRFLRRHYGVTFAQLHKKFNTAGGHNVEGC